MRPYNFGDHLSGIIVDRIVGQHVDFLELKAGYTGPGRLLGVGSILHYALDGDIIWGSGFREAPSQEHRFRTLDVRAVRGPRTREHLLSMGIECPPVYGDPAILMAHLFPEFKRGAPLLDYIVIPNIGEMSCFSAYKNLVLPTEPWDQIIRKMLQSRLVISSSLHGIIVAESFGIPARLIKMTWIEALLKYQDYYESTGRPHFRYATSIQEALKMGGEEPPHIDIQPLLDAFPWDYFDQTSQSPTHASG
ncbi:MAG: polysaccharide pyruvyl transferase family protein [Chlamydiia bacterium]